MRNRKAWNGTEAASDDGSGDRDGGGAETTTDADELAGSTMISLGYHRDRGSGCVECKKDKKTGFEGFSDVGVTVASAAFVLAGVALSTIPAALL
jgi:hypothetical protein